MTLPINTQPTNSALFPGQAQAPTMPAGQPTAVPVPTMPPDTMSVAPQAVPQVPLYPQSSGQGLGGMLDSLFSLLGKLVSGLTGFVKRLFSATPGAPGAVAQNPAFPAPTQPAPLPQPPVGTLPAPVVTTPAPVVTAPAPTPVTPTPVAATPPATNAPAPVVATPVTPAPTPVVTPPTQVVVPPTTEGQPPVVTVPVNNGTAPTAPAPTTPVPATPAPGTQYQSTTPLTAEELAMCQQQGILATPENFKAFITEAQALEGANALGPGSTQTESISELQQLLAGWGYAVAPTGQFDQATIDAVTKFKQDNGIAASYKMADGTPGVHPFVDEATKAAMIKKLETATPVVTPPTQYQGPTPVTPTPVVTPPTTEGQPPVVTVPVNNVPAPVPTAPVTPAPVPATPAPGTQYQAAPLAGEELAIAQQQGLLATRENFDAFMKEAQALEAANALGPGSTQTESISELQQLLAGWGYAVAPTGQFDQATIDAVTKFKRDSGVAATYKLADGTPGVHPFIDEATKAAMIKRLETATPVVTPPTQYQAPAPVAPTPVVTPPATNGQPPVVTVSVDGAPVTAPAAPVTVPGSQYQAVGLSAEEQAIAQQQGIQPSRENFDAFMREAQAIEAEKAIGPGSTERDAITELQGLMAGWGYAVAATGTFDAATEAALVKFKQDNGLAASYRLADGSPAYHPFIDAATKAKMVQKLGG